MRSVAGRTDQAQTEGVDHSMNIRFGPAGNPERFYDEGGKSSLEMPAWLAAQGLTAYEYSCARGVRISDDAAQILGERAREHGIYLSIHSPYYSNLATPEAERQEKSMGYILQSVQKAAVMGAGRVVVHMGGAGKLTRAEGIALSKALLRRTLHEMENGHWADRVTLCIETMGKVNQLGTVEETLDVCRIDDRLLPVLDFGHINARGKGSLKTAEDFAAVMEQTECALGADRAKNCHIHFSKIEYTHMGERKHLTFADETYGPCFEPLAEVLARRGDTPVIICESAGTMADDALEMQRIYRQVKKG